MTCYQDHHGMPEVKIIRVISRKSDEIKGFNIIFYATQKQQKYSPWNDAVNNDFVVE